MLQKVIQPCFEALFPRECAGCGQLLHPVEDCLCITCQTNLPRCPDLPFGTKRVFRTLSHRLPLVQMNSWLSYREGGLGGHLLKQIKYTGQRELGTRLGKMFFLEWKGHRVFTPPDVVVPIPLTYQKLKKRGYNQSEAIAKGFCKPWNGQIRTDLLKRTHQKKQQTQLSRWDRFENVQSAFTWSEKELLPYDHIMIIDDTLTTGATLEAAASPLRKMKIKISLATLAFVE